VSCHSWQLNRNSSSSLVQGCTRWRICGRAPSGHCWSPWLLLLLRRSTPLLASRHGTAPTCQRTNASRTRQPTQSAGHHEGTTIRGQELEQLEVTTR
jgi:hypothetical protein